MYQEATTIFSTDNMHGPDKVIFVKVYIKQRYGNLFRS